MDFSPEHCAHLCVDMQRMFAEETPWHIPWMNEVREKVAALAGAHAAETVFTRFLPASQPDSAPGRWRDYYRKWPMMTASRLLPEMIDLLPELRALVPPAAVFDKTVYSPWIGGGLHRHLDAKGVRTLVVTGGETDICVLSTVFGAVDFGYRVIVVRDAVCSAFDSTHDASLRLLKERLSIHVEIAGTAEVLEWWR